MLRWSWPAIAFLVFMIPLPHRIETALAGTLQDISTNACAVLLHTFGRAAVVEGNVLIVNGNRVEVVAACSGLGSLIVFFAMATGVALLSGRPMLDRLLLVASAVPIALGTNAVRIAATVLLQEWSGDPTAYERFHDLAGWLMMGLALAVLWLEVRLLCLLFIDPPENGVVAPTPERTRWGGWRLPLAGAALAVVLAHGAVHAVWSGRWSDGAEISAYVARLDRVPMKLGDWEGEALRIDPKRQAIGEIEGYVLRRYVHRRSRGVVSLLVVCGKAGPISVHPPDVCYRGAGFDMVGEAGDVRLDGSEFRVASFRKRGEAAASLRIFWSWNDRKGWRAPGSPRIAFGAEPVLFKMYVVREVTGVVGDAATEPAAEFLRVLLPALDRAIFVEDGSWQEE
jgi:exosortase/archaeosortase family protein